MILPQFARLISLFREIVKILSEKCGLVEEEVRERYEEVSVNVVLLDVDWIIYVSVPHPIP